MKLNDLKPSPGSKMSRKRIGRGVATGQGKTAGRGMKGQGARSGGGKGPYFEGGQLPLVRRLPFKRGFKNIWKIHYTPINLDRLAERFETGSEVSPETLVAARLINKVSEPVVILGRGELELALTVRAHRVSAGARQKIETAGGTVELIPLS
jgi:large subunit ribosomal protein L15